MGSSNGVTIILNFSTTSLATAIVQLRHAATFHLQRIYDPGLRPGLANRFPALTDPNEPA
jgi:hypothetical protein